MDETSRRPRVDVLSLGGTVAMTTGSGDGAVPTVDAASLVAGVPGLDRHARVEAYELCRVPSASLRVEDVLAALARARECCERGAEGVVMTTGTDTLEEVAYLVDLIWPLEQPVVVTGAMRPADALGSDGPGNLLAAVATAASAGARGRGCLVVLDEVVHTARDVRKTHTTRLSAFATVGHAPAAVFQEGLVRWGARTPRALVHEVPADVGTAPRVALLRLALGDDTTLLTHAAAAYDGVVVEAFGAGHVPAWWVEALADAAREVPVVVTSRTGSGALLRGSYAFAGSERDLVAAGLHLVDDMDGVKARILLVVTLLAARGRAEVDDLFTRSRATTPLGGGA